MEALYSFIKSHHQYCSLVWANQSKGGMSSLEKLQERFVYNNYTTPYVDLLGKGIHTLSFHCMAMKCSYWSLQALEWSITQVHAMYVYTKQKQQHFNKILLPKCRTTNIALKSFAYKQEFFGINYQTLLEHVSHLNILRKRLSHGQLTCDIYSLHCILAYLAFVDLTLF